MSQKIVYVVYCVDTEGPLQELLDATFERLKGIFNVDLDPSRETLSKLQNREIALGGLEEHIARIFSPTQLQYNDSWAKIDAMLEVIMSTAYRNAFLDSFGGGWVYNWHCVDHVGYSENPRRRDMGYHRVFDHYREMIRKTGSSCDGIHFHYHPMPLSKKAHHAATHYFSHTSTLFDIISRRLLDRHWFPCAYRAGFDAERPDSNWFLEQFIPFDFSNQALDEDVGFQRDVSGGRFGDWRRAPQTWRPYHPSHDDYQIPGNCRRWITRCLKKGARVRSLNQEHVDEAFQEAADGEPAILAFCDHDFRDMRPNIESARIMIRTAAQRFPHVKFRFSEVKEAMRGALTLEAKAPCKLSLVLNHNLLAVTSDSPTFGPQPFLAIRTRSGEYFHDNLDFQEPFGQWTYTFDAQTVPLEDVECVGVGTNDSVGNTTTCVMDVKSGESVSHHY